MEGRKTRVNVLFESDIFDRKGLFNAVHGRIKALEQRGGYEISAFCIQCRETALSRRVKKLPKRPHVKELTVDGVRYNLLWYRFSLIDWICVEKLHRKPPFFGKFVRRAAAKLPGCDLISAHSFSGAVLGLEASDHGRTPLFVTWHGSDIHTHPRRNLLIRRETERLTACAECNFYVSRSLMEASDLFEGRKEVLRNGIGPQFRRLPEGERRTLRARYGLSEGTKVVAYAGHFFRIKNTLSLPGIWKEVRAAYEGPLVFWVIGDGKEFLTVRDRIAGLPGVNCVFFGNREAEEMPDLLNCVDTLVLPSFNEGMPLITMEALSCGCMVVGSRVGGIPEVLGEEYTVPLGDGFAKAMGEKIVSCLNSPSDQLGGRSFGWEETARREDEIYRQWLSSRTR